MFLLKELLSSVVCGGVILPSSSYIEPGGKLSSSMTESLFEFVVDEVETFCVRAFVDIFTFVD